jgi:hypothetical protein
MRNSDGWVYFIGEDITIRVYARPVTRKGGEIVSDEDLGLSSEQKVFLAACSRVARACWRPREARLFFWLNLPHDFLAGFRRMPENQS